MYSAPTDDDAEDTAEVLARRPLNAGLLVALLEPELVEAEFKLWPGGRLTLPERDGSAEDGLLLLLLAV